MNKSSQAPPCVFCRLAVEEESARCLTCQVAAHGECRLEFEAQGCPTLGCAGDWPEASAPAPARAGGAGAGLLLLLAQGLRALGVLLVFPLSALLFLVGHATDPPASDPAVQALRRAEVWAGLEPTGSGLSCFEGVPLEARAGEGPSILGEAGLLRWLHEERVEGRRGRLRWREIDHGSVEAHARVPSERAPLRFHLAACAAPLGLPLLAERGAERLRGLRTGTQVTLLGRVERQGGVLVLAEAQLYVAPSREDALRAAEAWRAVELQEALWLGRAAPLLLVLGLGAIALSVLWRRSLLLARLERQEDS